MRLIWDNESGLGRRNSYAAGGAFYADVLATRIRAGQTLRAEGEGAALERDLNPPEKAIVLCMDEFLHPGLDMATGTVIGSCLPNHRHEEIQVTTPPTSTLTWRPV